MSARQGISATTSVARRIERDPRRLPPERCWRKRGPACRARAQRLNSVLALVVQVPDEIARAMRVPESERKRRAELELACALYAQGVLPGGKAAQLAGMQRLRFGEGLAARNVPHRYTEENLRQDLAE